MPVLIGRFWHSGRIGSDGALRKGPVCVLASMLAGCTCLIGCNPMALPLPVREELSDRSWWLVDGGPDRIHAWHLNGKRRFRVDPALRRMLPEELRDASLWLVAISPSGEQWLVNVGSPSRRFVIDITAGRAWPFILRGVDVNESDRLFAFRWSPDGTKIAIDKAEGFQEDELGPWPHTVIIADARTGRAVVPAELHDICPRAYTVLSPQPWLDAERLLVSTESDVMSDALGTVSVVDLSSDSAQAYAMANSACVLPGGRVLLETARYAHEFAMVRAEDPNELIAALGGTAMIGAPERADLARGVRPPMHHYYTMSPDGDWVIVRVGHVVGTWLGIAAAHHQLYLRKTDDTVCLLLRGTRAESRVQPGLTKWVVLPSQVLTRLGIDAGS